MRLKTASPEHVRAGVINPTQAAKIAKFDDNGDEVTLKLLESFIQETQENKRRVNLQVIATKRNLTDIAKHPDGPGRGVLALLVRDIEAKAPYSNVDYGRQSVVAELYGKLAGAMDRYRTKNLGFTQNTKGIRNMIKELFGESSGDTDAASFSKIWTETAEAARLRYNVAGGNISKRKDWGLPHVHDAKKIAAVSFEEWQEFIVPRLDRNRMYRAKGGR